MSIERVDIKAGNTALETFRAFRAWAEKVAAAQGKTLDPAWYRDGPEDRPQLYDSVHDADGEGTGGVTDQDSTT